MAAVLNRRGLPGASAASRPDYSACSGCSLCLLVCPVWRRTRDQDLAPRGRAKALQHGVDAADIEASIRACTLCSACEPACPEGIGLVDMVLGLRRKLAQPASPQLNWVERGGREDLPRASVGSFERLLLPDQGLCGRPDILARVVALLGGPHAIAVGDGGVDIVVALEGGVEIPTVRLEHFLAPLRQARQIAVADGLLLRHLRGWLPKARVKSLGEALSGVDAVRRGLRATDMYVIEPRAYHADYPRLVAYYDRLRAARGCSFNLDLQRIAIPVAARSQPQRSGREPADDLEQARWILYGRRIERIVVENLEDGMIFGLVGGYPVLHLAEVADCVLR